MNPILTVSRVRVELENNPSTFLKENSFHQKQKFTPKVKIEYKRVVSEFSWQVFLYLSAGHRFITQENDVVHITFSLSD